MEDDLGWAEAPWRIVTGCTPVSRGCRYCRGELRWRPDTHPDAAAGRPYSEVIHHPLRLAQPLQTTVAQNLHVAPGSDLFHDSVPPSFVAAAFAAMAATPWHTYQILTRRHQRMAMLMGILSRTGNSELADCYMRLAPPAGDTRQLRSRVLSAPWPLPNVWIGVVVEDQSTAESGISALLATAAAQRSIHVEPLLGEVCLDRLHEKGVRDLAQIDWIVVGERDFQRLLPPSTWLDTLQQSCRNFGIPLIHKQLDS